MSKEVIKLITERKMSDAKDMIDSILKSKLAESIDMFYEKNLDPVGMVMKMIQTNIFLIVARKLVKR